MDHALDPDGFEIKRAIVQHRGSAVMMPVDDKKRILLVRQYRLARAPSICGSCRPGTSIQARTPLQAARRELVEETGYRAEEVEEARGISIPAPDFWPKR